MDYIPEKVMELWKNHISLEVKQTTLSQYVMLAETHILPFLKSHHNITLIEIDEFVTEKLTLGLTKKYIQDILIVLNSILKYMYNIKFLSEIPELPKLKYEINADIRFFTLEEQGAIIDAAKNEPEYMKLSISLALQMGLRIGEACGLKKENIDTIAHTMEIKNTVQRIKNLNRTEPNKTKVIVTTPKTPYSHRLLIMPDSIYSLCCSVEREDFLIANRLIEPRLIQDRFSEILKNCNILDATFHTLRHTFACNCIRNGMDIKTLAYILGHKDAYFTLRRYVHTSLEEQRAFYKVPSPVKI